MLKSNTLTQRILFNTPLRGTRRIAKEHKGKRRLTIGWGSATIITNKLQGVSPLDYHNFTQLGAYATFFPIVIGSTKSKIQFKTIQEAIAYAKANPGKVTMSTAGVGQSWWVAAMSFIGGTGLNINSIPQPGAGAMTSLRWRADMPNSECGAGLGKSMVDSGQVRFWRRSAKRVRPPVRQDPHREGTGYDVSWESTNFLMGPPKLPKEIVAVLASAIEKAVKDPDNKVRQRAKHALGIRAARQDRRRFRQAPGRRAGDHEEGRDIERGQVVFLHPIFASGDAGIVAGTPGAPDKNPARSSARCRRMHRAGRLFRLELFFDFLLLVLGFIIAAVSWGYGIGSAARPGPGFYPGLIGVAIAVFAFFILLSEFRTKPGKAVLDRQGATTLILMTATFCLWIVAMPLLGYVLVTLLATYAFCKIMQTRGLGEASGRFRRHRVVSLPAVRLLDVYRSAARDSGVGRAMEGLGLLYNGFVQCFTVPNLVACFVGALVGTIVGVLPGLGPTATMAVMLPFTMSYGATTGLIMMTGVWYGAMYGGSTTSILVNIPGEAASVVTCIDGYQMCKKGRAGAALALVAIGSFIAGTIGILGLQFFAPLLGNAALAFGPPEFSASCSSLSSCCPIFRPKRHSRAG